MHFFVFTRGMMRNEFPSVSAQGPGQLCVAGCWSQCWDCGWVGEWKEPLPESAMVCTWASGWSSCSWRWSTSRSSDLQRGCNRSCAALVVRVIVLRPGDGWEWSAVVLEVLDVEGAVGELLWRTLIVVVAGAELLGFDVRRSRLLLFSSQLGVRRATVLRLTHPGGIAAYIGSLVACHSAAGTDQTRWRQTFRWTSLLSSPMSTSWKSMLIGRPVLSWSGRPLAQIHFAWLRVSFRSGGRSGRPLGLACLETVEEGREVRAPVKRWRNSKSQGKQLR